MQVKDIGFQYWNPRWTITMHAGGVGVSVLRKIAGGFDDGGAQFLVEQQFSETPSPTESSWDSSGSGHVVGSQGSDQGLGSNMKAVAAMWNRIRKGLQPVLKAAAAAVTLGTGASLGPEGPSVEIGTASARVLGRVLRSKRKHYVSLIAAGSGAGGTGLQFN